MCFHAGTLKLRASKDTSNKAAMTWCSSHRRTNWLYWDTDYNGLRWPSAASLTWARLYIALCGFILGWLKDVLKGRLMRRNNKPCLQDNCNSKKKLQKKKPNQKTFRNSLFMLLFWGQQKSLPFTSYSYRHLAIRCGPPRSLYYQRGSQSISFILSKDKSIEYRRSC